MSRLTMSVFAASSTTAILSLVGVLLGGFLTGGFQLLLARRKERAETRATARLLAGDLAETERLLVARMNADPYGDRRPWAARLPTDKWQERLQFLATWLPEDDWEAIEVACRRIANVKAEIASKEWSPEFAADAGPELERTVQSIRDVLRRPVLMRRNSSRSSSS